MAVNRHLLSTPFGLIVFVAYVYEHQPTAKEAMAEFDVSNATFKRVLANARSLGVDIKTVHMRESALTYYKVSSFGIFKKRALLDTAERVSSRKIKQAR